MLTRKERIKKWEEYRARNKAIADEVYAERAAKRRKQLEKELPFEKREQLKYNWLKNVDSTLPLPRRTMQAITVILSVIAYIWVSAHEWDPEVDIPWLYKAGVIILGVAFTWFWYEYDKQHRVNPLGRCPRCRNEEGIKYARHGYDWGQAWTWEFLGVREGRYTAGMRSNYTDCHCCKCGYTWTVNVDYRFL